VIEAQVVDRPEAPGAVHVRPRSRLDPPDPPHGNSPLCRRTGEAAGELRGNREEQLAVVAAGDLPTEEIFYSLIICCLPNIFNLSVNVFNQMI